VEKGRRERLKMKKCRKKEELVQREIEHIKKGMTVGETVEKGRDGYVVKGITGNESKKCI
jgi:hypothetical protein